MAVVGDLPSSIHAQAFTRAPGLGTGAWIGVDVLVRGMLIAAGIRAFSRPGARARAQGIAGALGIEAFVLGWTYLTDRGVAVTVLAFLAGVWVTGVLFMLLVLAMARAAGYPYAFPGSRLRLAFDVLCWPYTVWTVVRRVE